MDQPFEGLFHLTLGYFGGSITAGVGIREGSSWRSLVTHWFRSRYPAALINEVNATLGGTRSDLGAFRIHHDLIRFHPNLVFLEFAVNDHSLPPALIERSLEGIVRQILEANSATRILLVCGTMKKMADHYRENDPPSVQAHERIARHYAIPSVRVDREFLTRIAGGAAWSDLTTDGVHPTEAGHHLYAAEVCRILEPLLSGSFPPHPLKSPLTEPITGSLLRISDLARNRGWEYDGCRLIAPSPDWRLEDEPVGRFLQGRLTSTQPGAELRLQFHGAAIGLYWLVAPDSGAIEWSIDSAQPQTSVCWDEYARHFTRANYRLFAHDLSPGIHELRLRILEERHPESTGLAIRIGAFLVDITPPQKTIPP